MASLAVEKHVSIMAALDVMVKFLTSVQMKLLILRPTSVEERLPKGSSRMQKVTSSPSCAPQQPDYITERYHPIAGRYVALANL